MARQERVDSQGQAYKGSQLQIQIYVNRRTEELNQHVINALPGLVSLKPQLRWKSPLEVDKFIEYRDARFLEAVEQERHRQALREFWPRLGPSWDALAVVASGSNPQTPGVLLVEAKSYLGEIYGNGCGAGPHSRPKIEVAIQQTKSWLGVTSEVDWLGPLHQRKRSRSLYQSANRLAYLYFFRQIVKIPAWLVNVYFLDDPHSPTTRTEWDNALAQVKEEMGLAGIKVPHMAEVFLPTRPRGELTQGAWRPESIRAAPPRPSVLLQEELGDWSLPEQAQQAQARFPADALPQH